MAENAKFMFKVVLGGAGGVGKTTLLHRFLHGTFLSDTSMTIGVSFQKKEVMHGNTGVVLSIWDLGGQDRFRFVQKQYCQGAKAGVVFFDLTRLDTIIQLKEWVDLYRSVLPNMPILLAGTKMDLIDDADMLANANEMAQETMDQFGLTSYFKTSSKTGEGVTELFDLIIDTLLQKVKS
jgi:small GTP-binding protein